MLISKLLTSSILAISASAAAISDPNNNALEARSINEVLEVREVGSLEKRERVVTCCRDIDCFPIGLSVTCPCTKKVTVGCPEPASLHACIEEVKWMFSADTFCCSKRPLSAVIDSRVRANDKGCWSCVCRRRVLRSLVN